MLDCISNERFYKHDLLYMECLAKGLAIAARSMSNSSLGLLSGSQHSTTSFIENWPRFVVEPHYERFDVIYNA